MTPLQVFLAGLIAIGIPGIFLLIIYTLDLYASRTFRLVLICFLWGAIGGLGLAYLFNTHVVVPLIRQIRLDYLWLYVVFAPIAEEILKSLSLLYVSRQTDFTYFVDGAIYGFAAGIGFSITENFLYVQQNPRMGIPLALIRGFSTCLMHGTAAALVGAAIGRFRFQRSSGKALALGGGWLSAILLHAIFNAISKTDLVPAGLVTPLAVVVGLGGVVVIAVFISRGLREEGKWLLETLNRQVNVSAAEARAAQSIATLDELLEPIVQQFPQKAEKVQALVLQQAQMGIKRKVFQQLTDEGLKVKLEEEIAQLQAAMEKLRKEIGPYVMVYVRSVFPEGALNVWSRLEPAVIRSSPEDLQRWTARLSTKESSTSARRNIFNSISEQPDETETPDSSVAQG